MPEHCGDFLGEVFTEPQERGEEIKGVNVCNNLGEPPRGQCPCQASMRRGCRAGSDESVAASPMGGLCMPSCLLSLTYRTNAVNSLRWESLPWWLLQLHAPVTHLPKLLAAALWVRTQVSVTPNSPYPPGSTRKKPVMFPKPWHGHC